MWAAVPQNTWRCWYQDWARLPVGFPWDWGWVVTAPTRTFLGLHHNPVPHNPSPAWGDPAVPRPDPSPKAPCSLWAQLHPVTAQELGRARGQSQLPTSSPGILWKALPGARSGGCQAGWKVLVRGHQIQAKLERKLISCCRAKLQACCRRLRAGASPGPGSSSGMALSQCPWGDLC